MTDIVYLRWVDSCSHSNGRWISAKDLEFKEEHIRYETVGFLLKETDYSYVVIQSQGVHPEDQDHLDAVMEIPKVAVSECRRLNV